MLCQPAWILSAPSEDVNGDHAFSVGSLLATIEYVCCMCILWGPHGTLHVSCALQFLHQTVQRDLVKEATGALHRHAWDLVTQLAQYSVGNMTLDCRRSCWSMASAPVHKAIQYNIQVHILAIVSQLLDDALNLQGNTI